MSPASGVFHESLYRSAVVVPQDPLSSFPYFFYFVIDHVISLNSCSGVTNSGVSTAHRDRTRIPLSQHIQSRSSMYSTLRGLRQQVSVYDKRESAGNSQASGSRLRLAASSWFTTALELLLFISGGRRRFAFGSITTSTK